MNCVACSAPILVGARFCSSCGASQTPAVPQMPSRIGDYEVLSLIGEGGMGRVYKAIQPRLKREVCIKTLLPQYATDSDVVSRFEREALLVGGLKHPNIVAVLDVNRLADGTAYMVMEYVEGRSLRTLIRDEAPIGAERASALVDDVLGGLAEAHSRGIVHRDLKPANIMVTSLRDGREVAKVLDFGIARSIDQQDSQADRLTKTGQVLGTPGYMAPEQISGPEYDHRVDLFAVGAVLHEMLTGKRCFTAATQSELMAKVMLEDAVAPSSRTNNNVPAALDAVVLKALQREPKKRFQTALEFREGLSSVVATPRPSAKIGSEDATPFDGALSYAPLAEADGQNAGLNPRTLVRGVLVAPDEWERKKLLDTLERSLDELFAGQRFDELEQLVSAVTASAREYPATHEGFREVQAVLKQRVEDQLSWLLPWLAVGGRVAQATTVLTMLGVEGLPLLLERLPREPAEVQVPLAHVILTLEPRTKELLEIFKTQAPAGLKSFISLICLLPETEALPVVNAALVSTSAPHRQAALDGLSEPVATLLLSALHQRVHDTDAKVRASAMKWTFRLQNQSSVVPLAKLLTRAGIDRHRAPHLVANPRADRRHGSSERLVPVVWERDRPGGASRAAQVAARDALAGGP